MRDCWVLVGLGPDPYDTARSGRRAGHSRELIFVPGRDSVVRTLVLALR